jgi:2-polyprenyl-6-methoxyphenol hydroxylase-like FAD-dependent oxidoreductase
LRVLISGCGIAGPTLAWWLLNQGIEPVIVEHSPLLRTGGYIIDFWGAGFDISERMGLAKRLNETGYRVREVRIVDARNRRISGFRADAFRRIAHDKFVSLGRGDLAAAIYELIKDKVECIFGDSIRGIAQSADSVDVDFESGSRRQFDLVIGADGLHSRVRELVFGPSTQFEKYLGFKVAAFMLPGYEPRDEDIYIMYTEVGRQVARFSLRDGRTMFLFIFKDESADIGDQKQQKQAVREQFAGCGWECPRILAALDSAQEFYFDRVSQIRMGQGVAPWHRNRVALLGDAASCISFLGGQGSALAMTAAYLMAGELAQCNGNYELAFRAYEQRFGPFVLRKQNAALRFAGTFVPPSRTSIFVRNQVMRLMNLPFVADWVVGRDLADRITLPNYR